MAYNEQLADRIREIIAARENQVDEKQMFGGLCFMVNDKMCVTTREDHIMVRLGPEDYEVEVLGEGCSPMVHGGREMKGFIFVSADTLGSTEALKRWVDLALDFNATLDEEPEEDVVTVVVIDEEPEAEVAPAKAPAKKASKKAGKKAAAPAKKEAKAPAKKAAKKVVKKATKAPAKKAAKKAVKKAVKKAAKGPAKKAAKKAVKKAAAPVRKTAKKAAAPVRKTAKKAPARKAAKKGGRRK
jgi:TfoX/Sxy family transcriptional regulator of competence genes